MVARAVIVVEQTIVIVGLYMVVHVPLTGGMEVDHDVECGPVVCRPVGVTSKNPIGGSSQSVYCGM